MNVEDVAYALFVLGIILILVGVLGQAVMSFVS